MNTIRMPISFSLGQTVITRNASETLDPVDVNVALLRHAARDWGRLGAEDWEQNDQALRTGCRLLSAYRDSNGVDFWIITESDRSATTVLLPEDY